MNSRVIHEHSILSRSIDLAVTTDRLNVANLASFELIGRRVQLIEEVHAEDPKNPNWEGAQRYVGITERRGGAVMAPSLRKHVAEQLSRETAIMKEKRKAREARGGKADPKNPPPAKDK